MDATNGITVVVYDKKETSPNITSFLAKLGTSGSSPTVIYIVQGM